MGFTLEHIHRTATRFRHLMPARPNRDSTLEYSLKEGIFLMAPKLLEMKLMGFRTTELAAALASEGIAIRAQTLNRYLLEYRSLQKREAAPASGPASPENVHEGAAKDMPMNPENRCQRRGQGRNCRLKRAKAHPCLSRIQRKANPQKSARQHQIRSKDSMSAHKRIGRNMGRVELLAVRDTIKTMLEAGYDRKKIHCRLKDEGRVIMSYPTFCHQFKQQFMGGAPASAQNPARRPEASGLAKADKSERFSVNKSKLEDFQ